MKKRRGELSINTAVIVLIVCALLSLTISVFSAFSRATSQNAIAHNMARYIEIRGCVDTAAYNEFERLKETQGIEANLLVKTKNLKQIQFGDSFDVIITSEVKIGLGGLISIPITIKSVATGVSERYWK